jgi:hypothetical protein
MAYAWRGKVGSEQWPKDRRVARSESRCSLPADRAHRLFLPFPLLAHPNFSASRRGLTLTLLDVALLSGGVAELDAGEVGLGGDGRGEGKGSDGSDLHCGVVEYGGGLRWRECSVERGREREIERVSC